MTEKIQEVLSYEKTKQIWRSNPNSIEWIEANKLNFLLFGIHLNKSAKCECIEDLFFALKRDNIINKITEKMEKEFFLKKGVLVQSFNHDAISEHSTDAECLNALNANPGIIKFFDKVPDWFKDGKKKKPVVKKVVAPK